MKIFNYQELVDRFTNETPSELVKKLGFDESLRVAYMMLNDDEWDRSLQEYATNILRELRNKFPIKWTSNWKYDGFLGYASDIIFDYDERYASLKRAYDIANPKPPELMVALGACYWQPGIPPINIEEAESLFKEAIKEKPYIEGYERLRGLYKTMGKLKEQEHCEKILSKIQSSGIHLPFLNQIPEIKNHN